MRKLLALCLLFCALPQALPAQIFTHGSDPGHLRWWTLETPHYELLFPTGLDSLARRYGLYLEQYREATGRSAGMTPGAAQWIRHTPVVLHPYHGFSNGSMMYAPVRMDLFTRMDPYDADPSPWDLSLAVHEPRHLSQLQAGWRLGRPLNWIIGELWPSAVWGLYPNQALSEGDAVAVETALTPGARTRTADFLNYFRVALDSGDYRDFYRWRYGSFKHFAPDYYKVGYMTVAGARVFYDDPLFMKKYFDQIIRHPFSIGNLQKTMRRASGKSFKESFADIQARFHALWQEEAAKRGPFDSRVQLTGESRFPTDYYGGVAAPDGIYMLREGYVHATEMVRMDLDGTIHRIRPFSGSAGTLYYDPNLDRLYWSETVADLRWDLCHSSRIRYMERGSRRAHDLTREGRLYNPQPSDDGEEIAAVEYPYTGGSAVVVVSSRTGETLRRYPAPDGFQATEATWLDGTLYALAVSGAGYGLYSLPGWKTVLSPQIRKMVNLGSGNGTLEWNADQNGVNEWYEYTPSTGRLRQMSSNPHGATDFNLVGDSLYYAAQTPTGMKAFRTSFSGLHPREVDPNGSHDWKVEAALTAQEKALGPLSDSTVTLPLAQPKRYRRLLHPGRIHSWAPVYFNYDALSSMSFDWSYRTASLGVTGLFQNTLGTSSGYLGYGAHPDPDGGRPWRHSLHGKWSYTGLYPVIEASFDWNDRARSQYNIQYISTPEGAIGQATRHLLSRPLLTGDVSVWVPLNLTKGGHVSGLIPKLSLSASNHVFDTRVLRMATASAVEGLPGTVNFLGAEPGTHLPMMMASASLRAYTMLAKGDSQTYPRWGIGGEIGGAFRPGLTRFFSPNVYGYLYGYLPGIVREQGLRLTGIVQQRVGKGWFADRFASVLPRGFDSESGAVLAGNPTQWKVTADYAIPIYVGDISIFSPVVYIKNFLLIPHVDVAGGTKAQLWSAGASLTAELANLLWIPFDASVGVRASYLGGGSGDPWSVEMVFSVDI